MQSRFVHLLQVLTVTPAYKHFVGVITRAMTPTFIDQFFVYLFLIIKRTLICLTVT